MAVVVLDSILVDDHALSDFGVLMNNLCKGINDCIPQEKGKVGTSIIQTVKEQEAQFEQLTQELEAERRSIAFQLERCKLSVDPSSMVISSSQLNQESSPDSSHWLPQSKDSDSTYVKMSASHLISSPMV